MAEDQTGLRKDVLKELAPWSKLFSAFKIALDPKKLLLAAGGIVVTAVGWNVLATVFFAFAGSNPPKWPADYADSKAEGTDAEKVAKKLAAWQDYKRDLRRWNLMYEMAGTPPTVEKNKVLVVAPWTYDIGDYAQSPEEYTAIQAEKEKIDGALRRLDEILKCDPPKDSTVYILEFGSVKMSVKSAKPEEREKLAGELKKGSLKVKDLKITGEGKNTRIFVGEFEVISLDEEMGEIRKAREYKESARTVDDIRAEVRDNQRNARIVNIALELRQAKYKPYGQLRTLPWFEERGPNPYLLVTGNVKSKDQTSARFVPWERGQFANWLLSDQLPVLLEPLVKFFRPILFLFDPAGGFLNRVFLFLVIAWSLGVWALFGGAITRIAAVQVARANERVGLMESIRFVMARYKSYFSAPLFPLVFLGIIAVCLLLYGLLDGITFFVGDLIFPLLFPLVLLAGLIMAVVLVGLVGYPLMYATISAEGSDSFDAISRSYSYVYQAPWQYLWYSFIALVYGAVLVFFVGLMGSLMVYMGKWGMTNAPTFPQREPSYLFAWTPTSYGWRDLLLHKSPNATTVEEVNSRGQVVNVTVLETTDAYKLEGTNYVATFVVSVWIYLLFLLVIGFGYSYFWTASTIIYLLMRRKVDDTELDEIHLEEEPEQPWSPPVTTQPSGNAEAPKPAANPIQMVETPQLRTPAPSEPPPSAPPPPPATNN